MKAAKPLVEGLGDYLFIQCYRILGRRPCAFFDVKKHFAIFAFYHLYHGGISGDTKSGPEPPFRVENRLTVPRAQTI